MKTRVLVALAMALSLGVVVAAPGRAALRPMREKGRASEAFGTKCGGGGCFSFRAAAKGTPIRDGRFVGEFIVDFAEEFTNQRGLNCFPAVGEGTFKRNPNNKIFVGFEGSSCLLPKTKEQAHRMRAYGRVLGGTGDFQGARGRGALELFYLADEEALPLNYQWDGTIKG